MICCIEDDDNIRELIIYTLRNTGWTAKSFRSGDDFFSFFKNGGKTVSDGGNSGEGSTGVSAVQDDPALKRPTLLLLDIMLPGESGISILQRIRAGKTPLSGGVKPLVPKDLPVIMVTAKSAEYDKVTGLDEGADDYVSKPFGMIELLARIKAVLRRASQNDTDEILVCGNIELNAAAHTVTTGSERVELTVKEFELLRFLLQNSGAVVTRERLLERIWGYDFIPETRTVDAHVKTLRQKLIAAGGGDCIETIRGVGYRARH